MIKTNLIPWQHEAIIVTIPTSRELTQKEKIKIANVYSKGRSPFSPRKTLTELVKELENEGLSDLANLIVFPF